MLELYHSGLTTCSKQVRHCLADKALDYTSRYIELWRFENLHPDYLRLNPNGLVPTLVHDGVPITNSLVINEYLDDVFPDPPLRPANLRDRARMRLWTWTADEVHPSLTVATYSGLLIPHLARLGDDDVERILAATPVPERRERWRRITHGGYSADEIEAAFARIGFALERMDAALADTAWLAGESYSLADISMLAIVHRVFELRPEIADRYQRTDQWYRRLMARPSVMGVYRQSDEAPGRPDRFTVDGMG